MIYDRTLQHSGKTDQSEGGDPDRIETIPGSGGIVVLSQAEEKIADFACFL